MNSRLTWSAEGIDPSVRERAEAATRRAGMSLSDWLNSTVGDFTAPNFGSPADQPPVSASRETPDVLDIHQRLDSITRQIEQISRPAPHSEALRNDAVRSESAVVARQLNEAISRLDARLSQISNPMPMKPAKLADDQLDLVERAAAQVYRPSPPISPASLDVAVAEIAARQNELDSAPRFLPPRSAPPMVPATPAGPDFSSLERHLIQITSQIEALQRPDGIEQSIAAFRGELAEIRHAITEAMPRQAIESIENEIRTLSRRIDDTRQSGIDDQALAGIERALGEIREVLRSLTPAEQLAGYDDAIRNLGAKLDLILRASEDPSTVHKLESAIAALRAIVSNIASNDALARLSDDVHTLSSKVDQLARSEGPSDSFAILEQRIAALALTLESRERPGPGESSEHLEGAVRALSDRLDRMPIGNDNASAFAHLEQRVSYLLERLEASTDHRAGNLGRVEDGLQDILRQLENQQATFAAAAESSRRPAEPADSGVIDVVKRELSDIRFSQTETGRHTQESLEAVHSTLGHVVDRLAIIEGDLRTVRVQPVAPQAETPPAPPSAPAAAPAIAPQPKPELPNPAASQSHFATAPREFQAAAIQLPALAAAAPKAISEILDQHAAPPRAAIEPGLPPDHPLEPGTRPSGRVPSPSERIAASESAISEITAGTREQTSTSNFIAAARRAAQAAATAPPVDKPARGPLKDPARDKAQVTLKEASTVTSKIRSLLVGASVVIIVLGTFKLAMTLLDGGSVPAQPATESSGEQTPSIQWPADDAAKPAPVVPSMTSPTPIGRQSFNGSTPNASDVRFAALRQRYHRLDSGGAGGADRPQTHDGTGPADGKIAGRHRWPRIAHGRAEGRSHSRL